MIIVEARQRCVGLCPAEFVKLIKFSSRRAKDFVASGLFPFSVEILMPMNPW